MANEGKPITTTAAFIHSKLDDLGLTPAQFRVYGHISRRAGTGIYFESVPNCAAHCHLNIKTVRGAIKRLKELGLIRLENARPGETKTFVVTVIEDWPPLPNGHPGIETGGASYREATRSNSDPANPVSNREATPSKRIPPKVIPLGNSLEGNPHKGEGSPLDLNLEPAPKISAAERISLEKELEAIREQKKQVVDRASHDAFGPKYNRTELALRGRLTMRESEIKQRLGRQF